MINKADLRTGPLAGATFDAKAPTLSGSELKKAAEGAKDIPMGTERAKYFYQNILPILVKDAAGLTGGDFQQIGKVLMEPVVASGRTGPTLGLKETEKGPAADTDYPPRAANAVWRDFAATLGVSKADAEAVEAINAQIGSYPKAEGKYAPDFRSLSPELKALSEKASRSLMGEDVGPLTSLETAFKANLVLNNLTWHMTNFQRAAGDSTRGDPMARNNVFNTYSDNLAYAAARDGGLDNVIDMAISDAYNAGKPGVGKAAFLTVGVGDANSAPVQPNVVYQQTGERKPSEQAPNTQKSIYS